MLIIRNAQLAVLSEAALAMFVAELAADARKRLARHCAKKTDEQLSKLIREGIKKGQGLGIDDREDLKLFVSLVIAHGVKFEETPKLAWTKAILGSNLAAETRLTVLFDRLPKQMQPDFGAK